MTPRSPLIALQEFGRRVKKKFSGTVIGQPEEQLRAPIEDLFLVYGKELGHDISITGEVTLDLLGRPDFSALVSGQPVGHIELKAPGVSVLEERLRGRDRKQFERFSNLPNVLYSNGNEWALYRFGKLVCPPAIARQPVERAGDLAYDEAIARCVREIVRLFLSWTPIPPKSAQELAEVVAPLCRLIRTEVLDAIARPDSRLRALAANWRQLLFPDATDARFANDYAQTVTFALLLARAEGASTVELSAAIAALQLNHSLLSRALSVLTDDQVRLEIAAPLEMIQVVINGVDPTIFKSKASDPWLYFYEDFLQAYDPDLRRQAGVFYTPPELVSAQVALVNEILKTKLGKTNGFGNDDVQTLDPALGTGTYLLKIIDVVAGEAEQSFGRGAVSGRVSKLSRNLVGFELMTGPYSIAELRLARSYMGYGAKASNGAPRIYLTDTLESPHSKPAELPLFFKPISEQHEAALRVKEKEAVIVCIGNPPYEYHRAADDTQLGGWVRFGDKADSSDAIFQSFIQPALAAGFGVHLKHLYDTYAYFWRWALWKVFEHRTNEGAGVVAFVTASSYMAGKAFVGMREHMRHRCDEVWVIDLGGGSRGARKSENVFAIRSPVAICIAARYGRHKGNVPAVVHYARIEGDARSKLEQLEKLTSFKKLKWSTARSGWGDPFRPRSTGDFSSWPLVTDLFPWHTSGVQMKRTWPIGPTKEVLRERWQHLLRHPKREEAFKETRDRTIGRAYLALGDSQELLPAIAKLHAEEKSPSIVRYGYRSFDRQWVIADNRLGDFMRPSLWLAHGPKQVYFTSLLTKELGAGMAATLSADIPDMDYFCNRGARDIIPLWKDAKATLPNVTNGLIERLSDLIGCQITATDVLAYVYCVLSCPSYTSDFSDELSDAEIRIPITTSKKTFAKATILGQRLIWLHTFGERFTSRDLRAGGIQAGVARCVKAISADPSKYPESFSYDAGKKELTVGDGILAPVSPEVWDFAVSDFRVLQSWLGYRKKIRSGRRSSPLDQIRPESWTPEITEELLQLIWVLEQTISSWPAQEAIIDDILSGPLIDPDAIPKPTDEERAGPRIERQMDFLSSTSHEE